MTVVFVAFMALEGFSVLNHEPWRDEMAVWMVAKYNSPGGIVSEAGVQAQPALWYLMVKGVQQVIPHPLGMGLANLMAIGLAVLLMLKYSPFTRAVKVFLCFSYFIFYEYGTIARNYGISVLVVFAVCALYPRRDKYAAVIALLLAVGCSIQVMNIVFAVCFGFLLVAERLFKRAPGPGGRGGDLHLIVAVLIIGAGILLALSQAAPPEGSPWAASSGAKWVFQTPIGALKSVWLSFVPFASPKLDFWNTNILPDGRLMAVLSFALLALSCLSLWRKPLIEMFYLCGVVSLLIFFYRIYHGFNRHHGYLFLMLVISHWIFGGFRDQESELGQHVKHEVVGPRLNGFTLVCFLNFLAVFVPLYFDWRYPFSASRDVAQYLGKEEFQDAILLGDVDYCVAPVAGWLDREIYYPMSGGFSKGVIWKGTTEGRILHGNIPGDKTYKKRIWATAQKLAKEKGKDVVLILNYQIDEKPFKEFPLSIVADERYYLYRVSSDRDLSRLTVGH